VLLPGLRYLRSRRKAWLRVPVAIA
jgi:hypothetical protein